MAKKTAKNEKAETAAPVESGETAKYEAIDKCYGFQDRYYNAGDKVEVTAEAIAALDDNMTKYFKKHFKKVS
jgi:hypothetical protein